ncbi:Transposase IS4 family [Nitrosomonas europaea ATCC 19718]|uniref:Transposase IS4 family n=1 Tax=Nitrosomonas europaea (strain ATCC 19718 / CIP 103999 / KCTC 2705 / NBRC 14298) TaxID=228410 RepID=Q81ZN1_NITEU|nr:Transposase IS4 family [Nitrosomonas europaea ATCC 19718]CAD84472.1 Transposase IS4 family [Nitrosomonas europaea ATCC 19718]CAD86186.1 Transposase IS4 family [Nitrosomonas europaea ATCC 19718]
MENCSQTLYAVGTGRYLGKDIRCFDRRPGQSIYYDRQHDRARSSAGRLRKRGARREALGRSRGGLSTKIHMCVDASGRPLRFILTGGQRNDCTQALDLISGFRPSHVLADKGYDSDNILDAIASMKAVPVIPPRSNRKIRRTYDREIYKCRNIIERTFNKLKHWRRLSTRYDRKAIYFSAFIHLAAATLWL